jgi:hypothetical protein
MDSRTTTEEHLPAIALDSIDRRAVSFMKIEAGPVDDHARCVTAEEFEIGIGSWRAKIVKQVEGHAGRPRFLARFEAAPGEVWARRRMQRLADRLNARRRQAE